MEEKREPKYRVGDTVVITMYGTVGKVTAVKWLDGTYVYEINKSQGLYMETSLEMLSNYNGAIMEKEQVNIEYRFFIGDIVQVMGYGSDLFKVVGFRTEIWRYQEDAWEDLIYELSRIGDGEWLEAGEEELILVADAESADDFIKKLGHLKLMKKNEKSRSQQNPLTSSLNREKQVLKEKKTIRRIIDNLLDIYNDYRILFELFGDTEYQKIMEVVMTKLKMIVNTQQNKHI